MWIFVGRHALREPAVLDAAECKIPVQRRDLANSTCRSRDGCCSKHVARFVVCFESSYLVIYFFIKSTFLPSVDGPWPLHLVDAVKCEVTPTSAVGEHAAASRQPAGTLLKRNL